MAVEMTEPCKVWNGETVPHSPPLDPECIYIQVKLRNAQSPASITFPRIKKLAQKALKSPSILSTAETRELGASVMAHLSPSDAGSSVPVKKSATKKNSAKKVPSKRS